MITIHNFARGARGVRLFWLCEEMGLPYEARTVTYPPSAAYMALNPMGTVPFLQDEGGVAINESVAILLYLAQRYGPTPLLPAPGDPRLARVMQLTIMSEATLGGAMNGLMMARFGAPEADKRNWSVRAGEARTEQALAYVSDLLGEGPYLCGEAFTLADIAIGTTFGLWRGALDKTLPDRLATYQARLAERPAYQRASAVQAG